MDLKFNLTDSYNFKQTINCPVTRANMNEPSKQDLLVLSLLWRTLLNLEKLWEFVIDCYVTNVTEQP